MVVERSNYDTGSEESNTEARIKLPTRRRNTPKKKTYNTARHPTSLTFTTNYESMPY